MEKSIYLKDNEKKDDKVIHNVGNIYTDDNGNYYLLTFFDNYVFLINMADGKAWREYIATNSLCINDDEWDTASGCCDLRLITNEIICIEFKT